MLSFQREKTMHGGELTCILNSSLNLVPKHQLHKLAMTDRPTFQVNLENNLNVGVSPNLNFKNSLAACIRLLHLQFLLQLVLPARKCGYRAKQRDPTWSEYLKDPAHQHLGVPGPSFLFFPTLPVLRGGSSAASVCAEQRMQRSCSNKACSHHPDCRAAVLWGTPLFLSFWVIQLYGHKQRPPVI